MTPPANHYRAAAAALSLALVACQQAPRADNSATVDSAPARDTPESDPTASPPRPTEFAGMDGDGDGSITTAEHATSAAALFAAMDGDKDGNVTAAEMHAAQVALGGSAAMSSVDKIKVVDRDGDGILSAAEHAAGSTAMFSKMNANRDGVLSRAEFDAGHNAMLGGGSSSLRPS